MNSCKQAHKKLRPLWSRAKQFKASFHNQGKLLANRFIFGRSILCKGQVIFSPSGRFKYEVIGPCCRLFDREDLPWTSCSLQWRGKQPSWRRIGRRFVLDQGSKRHPSYAVRLLDQDYETRPQLLTLYWLPLTAQEQEFWHSRKPQTVVSAISNHPLAPIVSPDRFVGSLVKEAA